MGLRTALEEHELALPEETRRPRFEVTTGRSYELDLTFQTRCDDVPGFLRDSGFDEQLRDGFAPDYIVSNTFRYDWELGPVDAYAGLEERTSSPRRYLVVSSRTERKCQVFLYSSY